MPPPVLWGDAEPDAAGLLHRLLVRQKPERLEPVIRSILRIGGYQILFMDRVPHRAAVNEAVEMTRRHGRPKAAGMVNAVLRRFVEHWMDMPDLPKGSTADYLSLRYSHPKCWCCGCWT